MSKIPTDLVRSLNKGISDLCAFSIAKNRRENHCAHYVSHMMGYEFPGATCKNSTWADKQQDAKGATIRVNDLFGACAETGLLLNKPAGLLECLIFVTLDTNVTESGSKLKMSSHPRKHIGILSEGKVWNYSNSKDVVVSDTVAAFKRKFTNAYHTTGSTVEFYYGKFI